MSEQSAMTEHTIVIERELDAPRELVWKAWTDPDEVTRWWGPEHFTTPREKIEFDLRPGGVCRRGLGSFGRGGEWSEGRVPVEQAAATVAGEQLAFAELVPDLRAHAHAASDALLVFNASQAGAARSGDAVEADEDVGLDRWAEGFAFGGENG